MEETRLNGPPCGQGLGLGAGVSLEQASPVCVCSSRHSRRAGRCWQLNTKRFCRSSGHLFKQLIFLIRSRRVSGHVHPLMFERQFPRFPSRVPQPWQCRKPRHRLGGEKSCRHRKGLHALWQTVCIRMTADSSMSCKPYGPTLHALMRTDFLSSGQRGPTARC